MKTQRELTQAEQEEAFRRDYEARNGHLPGRAPEARQEARQATKRPREGIRPDGAAARLLDVARAIRQPFREWELILAAWKTHPLDFCIKGAVEYPSDKRVGSLLHGKRGLVAKGYLVKCGQGLYRVAGEGR